MTVCHSSYTVALWAFATDFTKGVSMPVTCPLTPIVVSSLLFLFSSPPLPHPFSSLGAHLSLLLDQRVHNRTPLRPVPHPPTPVTPLLPGSHRLGFQRAHILIEVAVLQTYLLMADLLPTDFRFPLWHHYYQPPGH